MLEFVVCVGTFTGFLLLAAALVTVFGGALAALGWELRYAVERLFNRRQ